MSTKPALQKILKCISCSYGREGITNMRGQERITLTRETDEPKTARKISTMTNTINQ
jgi:hypothetical protein